VKQRIRIFVSSPADVFAAREIAALTIERLAQEFARFFTIEPYLWEFEAMVASGHFQDSIEPPSAFDVVVLIVWSRLGTIMPERTAAREYRGIDGRVPVTGTEWEFEEALQAAQQRGAPDLLVYRNNRPAPFDTRDPRLFEQQAAQLKALNGFWERHFANQGMFLGAYTSFTSDAEFAGALENHLRKLIERRLAARRPAVGDPAGVEWTRAPFRGLEAYEFEHAPIFFGQDEALAKAMLQWARNAESGSPFLLVVGASGTGKSSLVKAGIVPKLFVPRRVAGAAFLRRVIFRPSDAGENEDVIEALSRRLTTRVTAQEGLPELIGHGQSVASLAAHLRNATGAPDYPIVTALGQLAEEARESGRMLEYEKPRLILVIDQLEELFTTDRFTAQERVQFVALLAGFVRSGVVWVIATMRSDFWYRANETPDLMRLSEGDGRLELLPPSSAQFAQMIRRPAAAAGVGFEVHATNLLPLNDSIADEVAHNPGALPLLSYLLDELYRYDVSDAHGHTLTYASYERLGKLAGAIATKAEAALERCSQDDRMALGSVLFALVSRGAGEDGVERAVARRVPLSTFAPGTPQRRVVDVFLSEDARLLVSHAAEGESPTIRVAHEALISSWDRARNYVQENEEALKIRRRVEERYTRWRAIQPAGSTNDGLFGIRFRALFNREQGLLNDIEIADGRRLLAGHRADTDPLLVAYIERSVAQERGIRARTAWALALVALVVSLLALVALEQRNAARSETSIANRTTKFMVDMFDNADPDNSGGDSVTVRKMLDIGADSVMSEPGLADAPQVRVELLTTIAQAYTSLGLYAPAEALLKQARDSVSRSIPDELRIRTLLASGMALSAADDDNQSAEKYLRQAADLARKHLDRSDVLRSQALTELADFLRTEGKFPEAEQLCREALDADRQRGSTPEHEAVLANTLDSLGAILYAAGELAAAEAPMREALKLREEALGMNHPKRALSLNNLGVLYYQSGRYEDALAEYELALPIYQKVYDPNHPEIGMILSNIGRSDLMAGHVDAAEPELRQSLRITEKAEGRENQDLVSTLNSLAMIDFFKGDVEVARSEVQRAESIERRRDHPELLDQILINAASLDLAGGDHQQAAARLAEARSALEEAHPDRKADAWRYAVWDTVNAGILAATGHNAAALETLDAAQKVLDQRFGTNGFYSQLVRKQSLQIRKPSSAEHRS